jgi:hypothetical protein
MKSKLKKITVVMTVMACIPLLAQAATLIDSKNIDKQIDNKNTGTVTIMNCSPYPVCAKDIREIQTKTTSQKPKKKSK